MQEKIGCVTLDLSKYSGQDFYSDGDVEDEILDIVKQHAPADFNRVIRECYSWPVLYHLSHMRENILSWMPLTGQEKVLEVGAGCGAITGTLAQKAASVTCIELSKRRSSINAYRHQDCKNIEIKVGNFTDIEPTLTEQYDIITLIGVLEYANLYIGGKAPHEAFLRTIAKHLAPGGRLMIAIENRVGLKYIAGCKEDHTNLVGEGLANYPSGSGVQTFTRGELIDLIEGSDLMVEKFYYPYPDYKLPLMIYSDDYLPKKGELSINHNNLDYDRLELFDEMAVFDQMIEKGLFAEVSNSFLVSVVKRDDE